jgi:hypothetical protein
MRKIYLTQNKFALVDDIDYEKVVCHSWVAEKCGKGKYRSTANFGTSNGKPKLVRMHRFIMGVQDIKGIEVDHINGDGLDNRRSNLRTCTHRQNLCNVKKYPNKSSIYKGVSWHNRANKWRATIVSYDKQFYLGIFHDEVEAAKAYDNKAKELHGEFATLNFKMGE